MKLELDSSQEWYPMSNARFPGDEFYGDDVSGKTVEVPDEVAERWKRVFAEFDAVQQEIDSYLVSGELGYGHRNRP